VNGFIFYQVVGEWLNWFELSLEEKPKEKERKKK
jgi:hypothetical protein